MLPYHYICTLSLHANQYEDQEYNQQEVMQMDKKELKQMGEEDFLRMYNSKVDADAARYTIEQIEKITEKRHYYPLLLDADPSKEMVEKYLKKGQMFTFSEGGQVVGEVVVLALSAKDIEIKNIAVLPERQRQGIGRHMIEFVAGNYAGRYENLYVGTADSGVEFYQKFGFEVSHRVKNFFTDNYPEPIVDNGIQCIDMIYLLRKI